MRQVQYWWRSTKSKRAIKAFKARASVYLSRVVGVIPYAIFALAVVAAALIAWDWITYGYTVPETGFGDLIIRDDKLIRGKTLWDWLELLIIPLVLAFGGLAFSTAERMTEHAIAERRNATERELATDRHQEALLQSYLDRMTELLLEKELRASTPDSEVRVVARARTLTVLRALDANRKRLVLLFLYESKLIERHHQVVDMQGADLSGADLRGAKLSDADLSEAILTNAKLGETELNGAELSQANLFNADLGHADLQVARLVGANLAETDLRHARLKGRVDLTGANLRDADMRNANLSDADLSRADLTDALLDGVTLSDAVLKGAVISNDQIKTVGSLRGAVMPSGERFAEPR